ncbi:hypothetical protein JOL62DRAFT_619899, partial [Phyllosticta paracitricarpa]
GADHPGASVTIEQHHLKHPNCHRGGRTASNCPLRIISISQPIALAPRTTLPEGLKRRKHVTCGPFFSAPRRAGLRACLWRSAVQALGHSGQATVNAAALSQCHPPHTSSLTLTMSQSSESLGFLKPTAANPPQHILRTKATGSGGGTHKDTMGLLKGAWSWPCCLWKGQVTADSFAGITSGFKSSLTVRALRNGLFPLNRPPSNPVPSEFRAMDSFEQMGLQDPRDVPIAGLEAPVTRLRPQDTEIIDARLGMPEDPCKPARS